MYDGFTAENQEFIISKNHIVEVALDLVGKKSHRYINNHPEVGQSLDGFDCSGFVRYVLQRSGFHIPDFIGMDDVQRPIRHANEFWDHYGVSVQTPPEPGDLIFFSRHGYFPTHIGIVRDEESYIHAPGRDDTEVVVDTITDEEIVVVRAMGRVLFSSNPIGYKSPTVPHQAATYRHHQQLPE